MTTASKISFSKDGQIQVPDHVILPFIEGDGTGPDIWKASKRVFDAAIAKVFGNKKSVEWKEILAGEKAFNASGNWLPDETLQAVKDYRVVIKGPLTTPVGGGIRSINVALRQQLDLYGCVRPVRYYNGVPSPMKFPEKVNMIIFRENTEDVYAGIEFASGSKESEEVGALITKLSGKKIAPGSAIGIKPISPHGSKRLVRMAIKHAIAMKLPSVTLVHKGNIMKFTEGGFREWGYQVAQEEFCDFIVTEEEVSTKFSGRVPPGKIVVKDRIADSMFQQAQLRPEEYSVLATMNLNGDYLSDALAAQVGGLGIAPGANIGDGFAMFEATHGTAPKYAGLDKVNPGSLILSGKMMFDYLGWTEVGTLIDKSLEKTITEGVVTYDLARVGEQENAAGKGQKKVYKTVSCSAFAEAMITRF